MPAARSASRVGARTTARTRGIRRARARRFPSPSRPARASGELIGSLSSNVAMTPTRLPGTPRCRLSIRLSPARDADYRFGREAAISRCMEKRYECWRFSLSREGEAARRRRSGAPRLTKAHTSGRSLSAPQGSTSLSSSPPAELGRGLAVWQLPARPRVVAGVAVRVVLEVILVLRLSLPKRDGLADLGHDLAGPEA